MEPRWLPVAYLALGLISVDGVRATQSVSPTAIELAARLSVRGDHRLGIGDLRRAEDLYQRALALAPDFPDALVGLGQIAMNAARYDDALAAFERARRGYQSQSDWLRRERWRRYRWARAKLDDLQAYLSQRGGLTVPPALESLAADFELDGRSSSAAFARVDFFIGNALNRLRRFDEAIAAWSSCARAHPDFAPVHNNLAVVYMKLDRLDEAARELDRASELGLNVHPDLAVELRARLASQAYPLPAASREPGNER